MVQKDLGFSKIWGLKKFVRKKLGPIKLGLKKRVKKFMINNKFRKKNLVKIILGPKNILLSEKLCVENVKKNLFAK